MPQSLDTQYIYNTLAQEKAAHLQLEMQKKLREQEYQHDANVHQAEIYEHLATMAPDAATRDKFNNLAIQVRQHAADKPGMPLPKPLDLNTNLTGGFSDQHARASLAPPPTQMATPQGVQQLPDASMGTGRPDAQTPGILTPPPGTSQDTSAGMPPSDAQATQDATTGQPATLPPPPTADAAQGAPVHQGFGSKALGVLKALSPVAMAALGIHPQDIQAMHGSLNMPPGLATPPILPPTNAQVQAIGGGAASNTPSTGFAPTALSSGIPTELEYKGQQQRQANQISLEQMRGMQNIAGGSANVTPPQEVPGIPGGILDGDKPHFKLAYGPKGANMTPDIGHVTGVLRTGADGNVYTEVRYADGDMRWQRNDRSGSNTVMMVNGVPTMVSGNRAGGVNVTNTPQGAQAIPPSSMIGHETSGMHMTVQTVTDPNDPTKQIQVEVPMPSNSRVMPVIPGAAQSTLPPPPTGKAGKATAQKPSASATLPGASPITAKLGPSLGQSKEDFKARNELIPEASKTIAEVLPNIQQVDQALAFIDKLPDDVKNSNMPFATALKNAGYKLGIASDKSSLIAMLSLGGLTEAASALKGTSRGFPALQYAMQHTPDPSKDSFVMMKDKLENTIRPRLQNMVNDAYTWGRKMPSAAAVKAAGIPGPPPTGSSASTPPTVPADKAAYFRKKYNY